MADDRTYIKLHDGMPDHPKVDPLTDSAFRLLISGWCWCSRHLTDGVMPVKTWQKRGTAKARKELLAAGMVEILASGDIHWHDYLEHQRSAAQVEAMKEQRRAAGRNGGLAKGKRVAKQTAKQTASETASKTEAETEGSSIEEPQTEGARKRVAKKPATTAPDAFPITDSMRGWGQEHASNVADPAGETARFLDYHRAKGNTFSDWTAAWRNWMSKASEYVAERGNVRELRPAADPHDEWGFA